MKTAICLAGTGRQIDYTFDNLKEYLIQDIKNSDIIVYITKNDNSDKARLCFEKLENTYIHIVEETPIDITPFKFQYKWPPNPAMNHALGRQIYLQMLKSRLHINYLIDHTEEITNKKYDRVIFSRMDVVYEKPVYDLIKDLELLSNLVWVPSFHNWGGSNDRFAVSNREGMEKYFSLYKHVEKYCQQGHMLHAESTLKHHLNNMEMDTRRFDIRFARYRHGEQHDDFNAIATQGDFISPFREA